MQFSKRLSKLPAGRWEAFFDEMRSSATLDGILATTLAALERSTRWLLANPAAAPAGATPYLRMFGIVLGGYLLARHAEVAK